MLPDRQYRFIIALSKIPLANTLGWHIALEHARNDALLAGVDPHEDPAIRLISLRSSNHNRPLEESDEIEWLKAACKERLETIQNQPTLALLGTHDIWKSDRLKKWFHAEARKALVGVADCANLDPAEYQLNHEYGSCYEPGSIMLDAGHFVIEVTQGRKFGRNVILRMKNDAKTIERPRSLLQLCETSKYAAWLEQQLLQIRRCASKNSLAEQLDAESAMNHPLEKV